MELTGLTPVIVAAVIGLVVLRIIVGAIKASTKLMVWAIVAVTVVGMGYVWFSGA